MPPNDLAKKICAVSDQDFFLERSLLLRWPNGLYGLVRMPVEFYRELYQEAGPLKRSSACVFELVYGFGVQR